MVVKSAKKWEMPYLKPVFICCLLFWATVELLDFNMADSVEEDSVRSVPPARATLKRDEKEVRVYLIIKKKKFGITFTNISYYTYLKNVLIML